MTSDSLAVCEQQHTVSTQFVFPASEGTQDSHHFKFLDDGMLSFGHHGVDYLFLQPSDDHSPKTTVGGCLERGVNIYMQYLCLGSTYSPRNVFLEELRNVCKALERETFCRRPGSWQTALCP